MKIFAGNSNPDFAQKVAKAAGVKLGEADIGRFADGEVRVDIHESVRGHHCFIIQSTCAPVNHNYMELFIMLDAVSRASAKEVTAVLPYYGYARQDRKANPRAPISAKVMAKLLAQAGANRLVTVDLHSAQIQGFFDGPVDHLYSIPTLAEAWKKEKGCGDEYVVVSPDAGGVERARVLAKKLKCSLAIVDKRRTGPNQAQAIHLIGSVKGKKAIIIDDMIDTAGTLTQSINSLIENEADEVFSIATHPVLSGPAIERLAESPVKEIWVTDTIPLTPEAQALGKIKVVSMAPVVADVIHRVHNHDSVSVLFNE